jgi:tetratricopeptide (TPR) repeat protein
MQGNEKNDRSDTAAVFQAGGNIRRPLHQDSNPAQAVSDERGQQGLSVPAHSGTPPPKPARTLIERLRDGPGEWVPLEEFSPLPRCLEWRLSREYWNLRGPTAFFGGDVPYAAINDGRLSADAAQLLAEIRSSPNPGPVRVLEVGGGSGLFAKLFLDELRILSPSLYDATTYFWTDASPVMIRQAEADDVFADHAGRVQTRLLPVPGMAALGAEAQEGFDLIIANYLLDNLPATILRLSKGLLEELEVRATLRADQDAYRLRGRTAREWMERASATGGQDPELVELYPWFSLECRYQPVDRASFTFGSLIPDPSDGAPKHWSHHETTWIWVTETLPLLRPGGGLLVNDYGHFPLQRPSRLIAFQHYGGSLANGINFDELSSLSRIKPDWQAVAPETDSKQLHSRWINRRADELSAGIFRLVFDGGRRDRVTELLDQARERAEDGRTEEARWLFWQAHERAPRCWHVLERWASFCLTRLRDAQTARDLAENGLRLHPRHPALWNVKGDTFYDHKRYAEAEACYRRAVEINPRETLGRLNLAYVHLETGRHAEALAVLAEALALDTQGDHREPLLEKQRQVLQRISLDARESLSQQINRFRNFDAPRPDF